MTATEGKIEPQSMAPPSGGEGAGAGAPGAEKTFGEKAFDLFNNYGLNFIGNSSLSVFLTYNLYPKEGFQKFKKAFEEKVSTPLAKGVAGLFGKSASADSIEHSTRSLMEILLMSMSGTLMSVFMYGLDQVRHKVIPAIDRFWNKLTGKAQPTEEEEKHREEQLKTRRSLGQWLVSRFTILAAVIGIDQLTEGWNNRNKDNHNLNLNSIEWKMGQKIYDKLSKETRSGIVNALDKRGFKKVPDGLKKLGEDNVERGAFAEMTRLLSKEVSLTFALSVMMDGLNKLLDKARDGVSGDAPAKDKEAPAPKPQIPSLPLFDEKAMTSPAIVEPASMRQGSLLSGAAVGEKSMQYTQ